MESMSLDTSLYDYTYTATVGIGPNSEPEKPELKTEYVVGLTGFWGGISNKYPQVLSSTPEDLSREIGWNYIDAMITDPAVKAAFDYLRASALRGGFQLSPALHGEKIKGDKLEAPDPETKEAIEICDFVKRSLNGMESSLEQVSWEVLYGGLIGNALVEIDWMDADNEDDDGKLVPRKLVVRPRWSYHYVVNSSMQLQGIIARVAMESTIKYLAKDNKFIIWTWDGRNGDPRGQSIVRPAYNAWLMKINQWPELNKFLLQFGSPSIWVEQTAADAASSFVTPDGVVVSAQQAITTALINYAAGKTISLPYGYKLNIMESRGDGTVQREIIKLLNNEIVMSILYSPRTLLEAEHGSKADQGGAQDAAGLPITRVQSSLCDVYQKQLIRSIVALNCGSAKAVKYAPVISLAITEQQDLAAVMTAVAALMNCQYLADSQLPGVDAMLGLNIRTSADMEDMKKRRDAAMGAADPKLGPDGKPVRGDKAPNNPKEPPK